MNAPHQEGNEHLGLAHYGQCGCPDGTPVTLNPITQTGFCCTVCWAAIDRARTQVIKWPIMLKAGTVSLSVRTELLTTSGRTISMAGILGPNKTIRVEKCSCGCERLVPE